VTGLPLGGNGRNGLHCSRVRTYHQALPYHAFLSITIPHPLPPPPPTHTPTHPQDIHEFQKEKQARLNQVPVDVLLRLHQLEHLPAGPGTLPTDLSGALVFDQHQLEALRQRMQVGATGLAQGGRGGTTAACSAHLPAGLSPWFNASAHALLAVHTPPDEPRHPCKQTHAPVHMLSGSADHS
jgi:hypothetical protein